MTARELIPGCLGLLERALRCARDRDPPIRRTCRIQAALYLDELRTLTRTWDSRAESSVWWTHVELLGKSFQHDQWAGVWAQLAQLYRLVGLEEQAWDLLGLCQREILN